MHTSEMIGHSGNEVGEKLAHSRGVVVRAQIYPTQIHTGRVIGGVPESRAPPVLILRKVNRHGRLSRPTVAVVAAGDEPIPAISDFRSLRTAHA
jgi:hypothetical protein